MSRRKQVPLAEYAKIMGIHHRTAQRRASLGELPHPVTTDLSGRYHVLMDVDEIPEVSDPEGDVLRELRCIRESLDAISRSLQALHRKVDA